MALRNSEKLYGLGILIAIGITAYVLFPRDGQPTAMQHRRESFLDFFTASAQWIIFSVPLDNNVAALAVINRMTGQRKLVFSRDAFLAFPRFSADGERVLMVRGKEAAAGSELLSCTIDDWNCRILVREIEPILWPVEVRKDTVLYVGSERYDNGRRRQRDFYLVESPSEPARLSAFEFYNLDALNVVNDKIVFATLGPLSLKNVTFPKPANPLTRASSEIFLLQIDWKERRLITPPQQLAPLYAIDGFSTLPTTSEDGSRVAFLNQKTSGYNLVVATFNGAVLKYVGATTERFSRPAFAATAVLANQLFGNRYETTLVDLANNSIRREAIFEHTPNALEALEHTEIHMAE